MEKSVENILTGIADDSKLVLVIDKNEDLIRYRITDIEKLTSKLKTIKYRPTGLSAYDELEARFKSIKELNDKEWENSRIWFAIWSVFGDLINKDKKFVHVELLNGLELSEYGLEKA